MKAPVASKRSTRHPTLSPRGVGLGGRSTSTLETRSWNGSGPGFLVAEMASEVGSTGRVAGIDISEAMLAMARERCSKLSAAARVDLELGDARKLPFPDESFDAAVSTQVYEYVSDVDAAIREVRRVLKPGGHFLVVDTDWDSIVWHGADPGLTTALLRAWSEHLVDPHLP